MPRKPFNTETVREINDHLQERLAQVEENFANDAYPPEAKREIIIRIPFIPDKDDPTEVDILVFSDVKLPKRRGKRTAGVLRDGKVLIEDFPEDQPLFDVPSRPRVVGGDEE